MGDEQAQPEQTEKVEKTETESVEKTTPAEDAGTGGEQ